MHKMFEKVNPCHPDKVADRIAGSIVDLAYTKNINPKIAVEVLIGHGKSMVTVETSEDFEESEIAAEVKRLAGIEDTMVVIVRQDKHLAGNQEGAIRCGDNGIFKGMPVTDEQNSLKTLAKGLYSAFPFDGKYVIANKDVIICQSNANRSDIKTHPLVQRLPANTRVVVNPLGDWTGGSDVDSGATNRKLGSDMGDGVTGGGLHGKDLSKADVSVNIFCHLWAQRMSVPVQAYCPIGAENVEVLADGKRYEVSYSEIVETARAYIKKVGGFEKFAEWGLI